MTPPVNVTARPPREVAAESWGAPLPDWIGAVVAECERTNRARTAARLGYSPSVVSGLLARNYRGDMQRVEAKVRGALMQEVVACRGRMGIEIGRDVCLNDQRMDNTGTSALRTRIYHACRSGCPHSRIKGGDDGAAV